MHLRYVFAGALLLGLAHAESLTDALAKWGGPDAFPPRYRQTLDAYLKAEDAYLRRDYDLSAQVLEEFWRQHPPGTAEWGRGINAAGVVAKGQGANFGTPVAYYALRMLTDVLAWRRRPTKNEASPLRFTVLLAGHSVGDGERHSLNPLIAAEDSAIPRESLALFMDYISAITDGRLRVELQIVSLPNVEVPVQRTTSSLNVAGEVHEIRSAGPTGVGEIWNAVPRQIRTSTDWWWIVYPSHLPADAGNTEYITGGMGAGPDGRSPAFTIDDLWLVRTPPHLGHGTMTGVERRLHMAQWFQHEFFHHLYQAFPQYKLEQVGHQWFNRETWPSDFEGLLEPDYFRESLLKRLTLGSAEGASSLRHANPSR